MNLSPHVHDLTAELLRYPGTIGKAVVLEAAAELATVAPEFGPDLAEFRDWVARCSTEELEESYTGTFDNSSDRALELGWQLFGENYSRGAFLVRVRQLLREHGIPENGELPDHVTHLLQLLGRVPAHTAALVAGEVALPALKKVTESLGDASKPWTGALRAAARVFQSHVAPAEASHA